MINKKCILLLFILIVPAASAFSWETHRYFAHHALKDMFPNCTSEIDNASYYLEEQGLSENKNYCYTACPLNGTAFNYYCSVVEDCPARGEASRLILAPYETECEHASNLAEAVYYLSHTANIMYQIKNEDPFCRISFEEKIDEGIMSRPGSFSVEHCCNDPRVCFHFDYNDVKKINLQISNILNDSNRKKLNEKGNNIWMYVVLAAATIIAAFIYNNHIKDKGLLDSPVN